jgi:hypothetical protein
MMERFAGTPGANGTSMPYAGGVRCNVYERLPLREASIGIQNKMGHSCIAGLFAARTAAAGHYEIR